MTAAASRRILVVDDEPQIPRLVGALLGEGYRVEGAGSAAEALARLEDTPFDVVLTDLAMPELDGIELIRRARRRDPDTPFLVFTAQASIETAVTAMREGAFDYLTKTAGAAELRAAVERAAQHGSLAREVRRLRDEVERARGVSEIIGSSQVMKQLLALVQRVASSDASVLILGESGTGKELFARAIHHMSPRKSGPFVAINCAAIPDTLLENELFGHEKGAYTGAVGTRVGRVEMADGGTLFLDEIGEISPSVQAKLLRVLQERMFERIGGNRTIEVDLRIVAATNQDLRARVAERRFREDLFFRLSVVPITVPPLRERREDIPLLVEAFLERFRRERARPKLVMAPSAMDALREHAWPGNVRELENCVERATIVRDRDEIEAEDLGLRLVPARA